MFKFACCCNHIQGSEICSFRSPNSWNSWQTPKRYHSPIWRIIAKFQQTKSGVDTENFHLDNIIDPPNDDPEIILVKPSPYFGIDCLSRSLVLTPRQLNINEQLIIKAQSLHAKYNELILLLNIAHNQNIRFHVVCIQETWFSETSGNSLVAINVIICSRISDHFPYSIGLKLQGTSKDKKSEGGTRALLESLRNATCMSC